MPADLRGLDAAPSAQKTIGLFVRSRSLAADQPARVGDFSRIDGLLGTVVDIGMRPSRLRALDRTLVATSNGAMSQTRIENVAARFRFEPTLMLLKETKPDQLRAVSGGCAGCWRPTIA